MQVKQYLPHDVVKAALQRVTPLEPINYEELAPDAPRPCKRCAVTFTPARRSNLPPKFCGSQCRRLYFADLYARLNDYLRKTALQKTALPVN
jgi:hypothetical protein